MLDSHGLVDAENIIVNIKKINFVLLQIWYDMVIVTNAITDVVQSSKQNISIVPNSSTDV